MNTKTPDVGNYYTTKDYGMVKVIGIYPKNKKTTVVFKPVSQNEAKELPLDKFNNNLM